LVALLNLFLVVFVFEPSLLPPRPLARNLKLLVVVGVLVVLVAALLFVLLLLLEDAGDVCTKLEFLFKEEEEKEVLATAALAELPKPPKQLSTTIKLLAVRMTTLSFFLYSKACVREREATDYPTRFSALVCAFFWPHKTRKKGVSKKKVPKP
jgi:hypothetical protein